ncbi:hypothetical protein Trydic_g15843 [Trypoxylus dichotomus]
MFSLMSADRLQSGTIIITGKIKTEPRSSTVESGRTGVIHQRKEQLVVSPERSYGERVPDFERRRRNREGPIGMRLRSVRVAYFHFTFCLPTLNFICSVSRTLVEKWIMYLGGSLGALKLC